jgi:hypothetical protein
MENNQPIAKRQGREPGVNNGYLSRVGRSVFSRSREKKSLKKAFEEFRYTRDCHTCADCSASCELCGHQGLRHQFEIVNRYPYVAATTAANCDQWFGDIYLATVFPPFFNPDAKTTHRIRANVS